VLQQLWLKNRIFVQIGVVKRITVCSLPLAMVRGNDFPIVVFEEGGALDANH